MDELIKMSFIYIYKTEYYLAIKKSEIMPVAATRNYHTHLVKTEREIQISYDITYVESKI